MHQPWAVAVTAAIMTVTATEAREQLPVTEPWRAPPDSTREFCVSDSVLALVMRRLGVREVRCHPPLVLACVPTTVR